MRKIIFFLTLLILTACSPTDPHAMIAAGQAALQATSAAEYALSLQARSTQAAQEALSRQMSFSATATAQSLSFSATANAARATATIDAARAIQAKATAEKIQSQSTQDAYLAMLSARATQTRLASLQEQEVLQARYDNEQAQFTDLIFRVTIGLLSIFGVVPAGLYVIWKGAERLAEWLSWKMTWEDRRRQVIETAAGPFVYTVLPDGREVWQPASEVWFSRPRMTTLTRSQTLQFSERIRPNVLENADGLALAARLVRDAASLLGMDANIIPSWRALKESGKGWTSGPWQSAVNWLKSVGAVVTVDRERTSLSGEYPTLYSLSIAMTDGKLSPAPTRDGRLLHGTQSGTERHRPTQTA